MDNIYSGEERRGHKRVPVNFIIRYHIRKPLEVVMLIGNMEVNAVMIDLCESGMSLITDYDIPVGTELSLKFTLVNTYTWDQSRRNKVIEVLGCVADVIPIGKSNRLGISFTELSKQHAVIIADFVKLVFQSPA
ncbi:MAG: PilZ domain-containing protein [Candidatus Omnitrophota bacterium]|nr:PilZ domain-containing protein [Candidatus Omnitrophota bacterium]MBU1928623.1 PilZ domain-containing protein [Candidatus Omnitrophota bacterium]MBU2034759.1 PilZ domain-containing protein [Candidatus Omnitrophota bacterium]MBU2221731.1 PilZ domain-containing protein [Candidatus Omnitrophota bacterium]MBU2257711.1 PilZ domain-containing protein [Candidatus Omnitrophota bacterium]